MNFVYVLPIFLFKFLHYHKIVTLREDHVHIFNQQMIHLTGEGFAWEPGQVVLGHPEITLQQHQDLKVG